MKRKGNISLGVLAVMTVLLTAGLGLSMTTTSNLRRAQRESVSGRVLQAANAGLELAADMAFQDLGTNNGVLQARAASMSSQVAQLVPGAVCNIVISPNLAGDSAWISSTATFNGMTRSVRSMLTTRDVGIWSNAIFAGTGASGRAINGNVDIRGSVHLLGDGESYSDLNSNGQRDAPEPFTDRNGNGVWDPGEPFSDGNLDGVWSAGEPFNDSNRNGIYDPPLLASDLNSTFSGNAFIGNNYTGMPTALESQVATPPTVSNMETLFAELRVKHGQIGLSGSAGVGTGDVVDGGTSKGTMDGTFVNDGFTGSRGDAAVFSDNGSNNAYDLDGYGIEFPLISGVGSDPYQVGGTNFANLKAYYDARALVVPVSTITSTTPAFSYSDGLGNSISFTPAGSRGTPPAVLTVNGVVKIAGDLQVGSKDTIRTAGRGTVYSAGTIRIDGNLLPASGQTFPTTTALGWVAQNELRLATGNGSSQLSMTGAFYAQDSIISAKQNQIAGTFVSNYFDLGTNVPNIYQVPSLVSNMPPHMPGDRRIYSMKMRTWRERRP